MLNQTIIIGRVTQEPILRTVNTKRGETSVCNFNVAVNEYYQGNERTTYFKVTTWGQIADRAHRSIAVGTLVYVSGKVSINQYVDANQQHRASIEITARDFNVISGWKNTSRPATPPSQQPKDINEEVVDLDSPEIASNHNSSKYTMGDQITNISNRSNNQMAPSGINKYHHDNQEHNDNNSIEKQNFNQPTHNDFYSHNARNKNEGDDYE